MKKNDKGTAAGRSSGSRTAAQPVRSRPGQLTLRQIEIFHAIMVTGSLSEAGRLLHVTQPVVSRALATIEQRLGFLLFDRVKSRLYPNAEARALFDGVAGIQQGVERVNDIAFRLAFEGTGTLRIVSSPSFSEWLIPAALARLNETHPDVRVRYRPMSMDMLEPFLLGGQADVAILSVPMPHPNIVSRAIPYGDVVCAIPLDHPLARQRAGDRMTARRGTVASDVLMSDLVDGVSDGRLSGRAGRAGRHRALTAGTAPVSAEMLADSRLVGYATHTPFNDSLALFWGSAPPQPHIEVRSPVTALSMVRRGLGVALVDAFCVDPDQLAGIVVRPVTPAIPLSIHIANPNSQPLSLLSRAFVTAFEAVLDLDAS